MATRRGLLAFLLDLLYPPVCVGCQRRGEWLCADCRETLPRLGERQARRVPSGSLDGSWSACAFDGSVRVAIHRLKYGRARHFAEPLAEVLAEAWTLAVRSGADPEALVPVALHQTREAERGYNQAALLAALLGKAIGLPVESRALRRTRDTPSQTRLSAAERRANVAGAFAADPARVDGRRIMLIDDVETTGSTLSACAVALRDAGATAVWSVTVARAR